MSTWLAVLETIATVVSIAAFGGWWFQWTIHVSSIFIAKWKLHRRPVLPPSDEPPPGISIVKPLVGVDSYLYSNLETYFTLQYPGQYEILFCFHDSTDPASMVAKALMAKYPHVNVRIFTGGSRVGANPKINNMAEAMQHAKFDLVYIADSGLHAEPDTLQDLVLAMRPDVGMVHQFPYIIDHDPPDFANTYHKVFFGTHHAKMYLFINWLGLNCTTGMSSMIRRSIIERAGGPSHFARYLAEDYFLAKATFDQGWRIALTSNVALQASGDATVRGLQHRIMRWVKLRTALVPFTIVLEPIAECFMCGFLASLAVCWLSGWSPLLFFLMHCVLWFLLDYILLSAVNRTPLSFSRLDYLICWIYKEAMTFPLFVRALCNPVVSWRGTNYITKWGGMVEEQKKPSVSQSSSMLVNPPSSSSSLLSGLHRVVNISPLAAVSSASNNNLAKSVSTSAVTQATMESNNTYSVPEMQTPADSNTPSILLSASTCNAISASAPPSPSSAAANGPSQQVQQHQFLAKSNSSNNDSNSKSQQLTTVYTL